MEGKKPGDEERKLGICLERKEEGARTEDRGWGMSVSSGLMNGDR